MAYGVATTNLFALLDDENEDPQVLAATKVAKVAPKKEEAPKEEAKKPAAKPAANQVGRPEGGRGRGEVVEGRGRGRGRGEYAGRGEGRGRGRGRGDYFSDRPPRTYDGDRTGGDGAEGGFGGEGGNGDNAPRGRGGYRGRGRGRGGRRGDGEGYNRGGEGAEGEGRGYREDYGERRPRRQFERHDGTGRGHEGVKRGGSGKGNWGSDADAVATQDVPEPTTEEKPEEAVAADTEAFAGGFAGGFGAGATEEPAKDAEAGEAGEAKEAEQKEEEEVQMTLDEYEKILAEKKAQLNKQADAGEVDLSQFKGMAAYKRKDEDEDILGLELKNKKEAKQAKEKARKEVVTLETGFKVQTADEVGGGRGRGGRGGRGRGRGDRPEGPAPASERSEFRGSSSFRPPAEERGGLTGGRGRGRGRGTGPAPLIDDESAFPSLG